MSAPGKQEWVYSDLRAQLEAGRRRPGDRLVIAQLADELGVSALPVREALRRLEAEGWVHFRPNHGAVVAELSAEDWADSVELLAVLEGRATALAVPRLTGADVERLRALNAEMAAAVEREDIDGFLALNRDFHEMIHQRCPSSWLTKMLEEAQPRFDTLAPDSVGARTHAAVAEHADLIELIAAHADANTIEAAARTHKLNTAGPPRA